MRSRHAVVWLTLALLVATARAQSAPVPSVPGPIADDPRVAQALQLARTWLEAQRAYDQLPGLSAAVVHDQELLWSGGFGLADVEAGRPAAADTIYSICSISKLFTGVAVMQQRDAGRLRLDDPVGRHLPWFHLKRTEGEGEVTLEGLLTHASGLPRESDFPYWSAPDFAFPTHEQIVEKLPSQSALYTPETRFQYSNLGLTLAGEVAAAAAGEPYPDYVRGRILAPLGLASTTPEMPAAERGKRLAIGYSALDRQGRRHALPFFDAKGIAPAAGFASTAPDLARFASWQFRLLSKGGSEVLKATTLREMQRVHWAEPDFKTLWGLAFAIWREGDDVFVGHGGSCPGYRAALLVGPKDKLATVVMVNAQGVDTGAYAQRLREIVAPAVAEAAKEPGKGKPIDPGLLRYLGAYDQAPWGGETAVVAWGEGLAMLDLPSTQPVKDLDKLKKVGEHTFRRVLKDDSLGEEIVFEMGPDGRPTGYRQHSNFWPRMR
jgi:CubicO group peptidase (beta-lactamase class C family)